LDGYVTFTNVPNLTASASSDDRFTINQAMGGSLTGVVTGNVMQHDSIYVEVAAGTMNQSLGFSESTQPDNSLLDTWTITKGTGSSQTLVNSTDVNDPDNLIIDDGTTGTNQSVLAGSNTVGMLQLTSTTGNFQPVMFDQPTGLLQINLGTGSDTLSIGT